MGLICVFSAKSYADDFPPDQVSQPASGLSMQAIAAESGSYASNPLLSTTTSKPLIGSTTSPEMILKDANDRSSFGLDTRVDENVFNQALFNSTDVHSSINLSTKNELWSVRVAEATDYDTTRTSEISNFNFVPTVARHFGLSLTPQIAYTPTPIDSLSLGGSAQRSEYNSSLFTNYENFTATPTYTHQFTPLNSGLLTVQAQRYQSSPNANVTIDSIGPLAGWQTTLTPRISANFSLGAQTTRQYQAGAATTPWTWHTIYNGGLSYRGEQDILDFQSSRQQYPYGNGTEALQTNFTLTNKHQISKLSTLNLGANYLTSTYQITAPGNLQSQAGGSLGLTYHITEHLDVTGTYQYLYETLAGYSTHPQNNSAVVSLTYRPNIWTFGQ